MSAVDTNASRSRLPGQHPGRQPGGRSLWLWATLIVVITTVAYLPAFRAGFVWDDDFHIAKPALQSLDGLKRIWTEPAVTLQYYPLTHSTFWLLFKFFGTNPAGYHAINIGLHIINAILVLTLLRRLRVTGAELAAMLFAIHPVMVESVAWITELKNTLSGMFYLLAMLAYFRFSLPPPEEAPPPEGDGDASQSGRKWGWYAGGLVCFAAAMLSKTTACTLPAAILVVVWWKRGRLSWRGDVLPLLPWFAAGLALGMMTVHFERNLWGASGGEYDLTMVQRVLLAGRAVWFYLAKLVWPTNLTFFYEQWTIDLRMWWQWVYPITALVALLAAWTVRKSVGRGLLAAMLLYGGTLLPGLGFFNLYWHIYTYVCDHVQYLASIAVFALLAATGARLLQRWNLTQRLWQAFVCAVPVGLLAVLTWQQTLVYRNLQTLYEDTIAKNPTCWMAYSNLGLVYKNQGGIEQAIPLYERAIELRPNYDRAHYNLGVALEAKGRLDEALAAFERAIEANPENPYPYNSIGLVYARQERLNEAVHSYQQALKLHPELAAVRLNLATTLARLGNIDAAKDELRTTLQTDPAQAAAAKSTVEVFLARRMFDQAVAFCDVMLEVMPEDRAAQDLRQRAVDLQR